MLCVKATERAHVIIAEQLRTLELKKRNEGPRRIEGRETKKAMPIRDT